MKFNRKMSEIQDITMEEVLYFYNNFGWCFEVADREIGAISIEPRKK